ncbi:AAA family ATPase [Azospirillum sp.]|uniref:AAA family ATPase n=1 Tax=Azospirillum sp. TaxID=34012 RepID=UPI0026165E8F|nr:AAA family ATPase [Azospirillum sp.]
MTDPLKEILTTADRARREKPATNDDVPAPLRVTDPTTLQGVEIPQRRWLVKDWLPWRQTGLFYGDGATGKSLLAQQLMASAAVGQAWLGLEVTPCRTWGLFCEDDGDELHRRQVDVNRHLGVDFRDLGNMRWISRTDAESNLLMTFDSDGIGHLTDLWFQVREEAAAHRAQLVVLDTAADTFGGNEINRSHVRQFIQRACSGLARELDGAVLLCAHPSAAGMASGEGTGGSTGWSNSVRARWYLTRPKAESGEAVNPDLRDLSQKKGNYAQIGEKLRLEWHEGVFRVVGSSAAGTVARIDAKNREREAEEAFLAGLKAMTAQGRGVSHSPNAGKTYAPKALGGRAETKGFTRAELEGAMERLFNAGRIEANVVVGRKANRQALKSIAECPTPAAPANDDAAIAPAATHAAGPRRSPL